MPCFVILLHRCPPDYVRPTHFDLMLEAGDVLRTWSLAELPSLDKSLVAEKLPDHRKEYLTYEGPLSGNRGEVSRCDAGEYETVCESAGRLTVRLHGTRLEGLLQLTASENDPHRWLVELPCG